MCNKCNELESNGEDTLYDMFSRYDLSMTNDFKYGGWEVYE
jgi:hypothetical protein